MRKAHSLTRSVPIRRGMNGDEECGSLPRGADRNVKFSSTPERCLHPNVALLLKTGFRYPPIESEERTFDDEGIAHFAKLLVPDGVIGELGTLWHCNLNDGNNHRLSEDTVTVTCSPLLEYFPGTEDRVLCIRGQGFENITRRTNEVLDVVIKGTLRPGIRIAVPRRVVGTVIGKGGSHIQSLRQTTQATIHISPLFVTAEYACSERVISVCSRDLSALRTATLTLLTLINKHPERASCQRVVYQKRTKTGASNINGWPPTEDKCTDKSTLTI